MRPLAQYALVALGVGALALALYIALPVLVPVVLAASAAVVLFPIRCWIMARIPGGGAWRSAVASLVTIIALGTVILVPIGMAAAEAVEQARAAYADFVATDGAALRFIAARADAALGNLPGVSLADIAESVVPTAQSGLQWVIGGVGSLFSSAAAGLVALAVFIIALWYFLKDGPELARYVTAVSPLDDRDDEAILVRLRDTVYAVLRGNLSIALIQGAVAGVGMWLFGVPYPFLWGAVAAAGALVPTVGTGLVLIPAVLYLAVTGSFMAAVGLTVWGFVAVGLVDNALYPYLVGSVARIHPLPMLVAVIGGVITLGPAGVLLGPLIIGGLAAVIDVYRLKAA